jgi:hypothetical protein
LLLEFAARIIHHRRRTAKLMSFRSALNSNDILNLPHRVLVDSQCRFV